MMDSLFARYRRGAHVAIAIGAVLSLAALASDAGRHRFAFGWLLAFAFLWSVSLGGIFFVALHHVTHAVWSVIFRRIAEALGSAIRPATMLFLPLVFFAARHDLFALYPWTDVSFRSPHGQEAYLNLPFFALRGLIFFAIWNGFSRFFERGSIAQNEASTLRMRRAAGPFLLLFAFTLTFAGIDWIMSLEPHWTSTIFGVYLFTGMTLSAIAIVSIVAIGLRRAGVPAMAAVTNHHIYNLGALLFAFTCFWAYIAYSQYMLIWYANLPEETFYLLRRLNGGWRGVSILLALLRFVIPFFLLLSRRAKLSERAVFAAAWIVLAGQALDLYWYIMPQLDADAPRIGWQEWGPFILMGGILVYWIARFLEKHGTTPTGDPMIESSRSFRL